MSKLKITGDVSGVKKSILDLGKDLKSLGKTKISVFSETDRKFIKNELTAQLSAMKSKLNENKDVISKLIREQQKLEKGSKAELDHRKKIVDSYRQQSKLAQQMERMTKQRKEMGGFGGFGGSSGGAGGMSGLIGTAIGLAGRSFLAVGALAVVRGIQASGQYTEGARNRVRLKGLGVGEDSFGSPAELAAAGLTEQDMIKRRIQATSRLGRAGGSNESVLQQAKFERAYGLEEGSLTNVAGALRGQMGGAGADQTQAKLQASILASGIEDAIGPYLEAATDLLSDINKNGMSNTDEMIRMFATMTKSGERTPEQIAEAFKGIDQAVRGATGESNAFLQTAFARGGIGGGTVGGTRFAMQSGGITGLNKQELARRGYNPQLLQNMEGQGMMQGAGTRTGAILEQFKKSAGLGKGQSIGGITDVNTMVGLSQMANSVLGTEGMGGFDALQMMEKVQNKQMTQKQFDDKLQEMKDKKDPMVDRLNKINDTLAGQTTVLKDINTNLMENLGKSTAKIGNMVREGDNAVVEGTGILADTIDQTGVLDAGMAEAKEARKNLYSGWMGSSLYDTMHPDENAKIMKDAEERFKQRKDSMGGQSAEDLSNAVEKGMTKAMTAQQRQQIINNNNKVNVKVQTGDGRVINKTHK